MSSPSDIREAVTARIVAALEAGTPPWRQPWTGVVNTGLPSNVVSRRSYSGVNPLVLSLAGSDRGFLLSPGRVGAGSTARPHGSRQRA